ncbi:uncharacterized protein [Amphiura filiformis]|uniref:uncharacterized protein n=1 Tax=Amphiura filiformis TaxID=82378 RepID=UPI003B2101EA
MYTTHRYPALVPPLALASPLQLSKSRDFTDQESTLQSATSSPSPPLDDQNNFVHHHRHHRLRYQVDKHELQRFWFPYSNPQGEVSGNRAASPWKPTSMEQDEEDRYHQSCHGPCCERSNTNSHSTNEILSESFKRRHDGDDDDCSSRLAKKESITSTYSSQLKFGIDRLLAKDKDSDIIQPTQNDDNRFIAYTNKPTAIKLHCPSLLPYTTYQYLWSPRSLPSHHYALFATYDQRTASKDPSQIRFHGSKSSLWTRHQPKGIDLTGSPDVLMTLASPPSPRLYKSHPTSSLYQYNQQPSSHNAVVASKRKKKLVTSCLYNPTA